MAEKFNTPKFAQLASDFYMFDWKRKSGLGRTRQVFNKSEESAKYWFRCQEYFTKLAKGLKMISVGGLKS